MLAPQVAPVWTKSAALDPVIVIPANVSGPLLLFVTVTDFAELVLAIP